MFRRIGSLAFLVLASVAFLRADSVTFSASGHLTSDATAVSSVDPVITDVSTINFGDPFSLSLIYDSTSFTQPSSNTYVLDDARLSLSFDGYNFDYSSTAGNFIEFATPGAFGPGTVSFLVCTASDCTNDFLNLYFTGDVTSLATLASQASGLSGDPSASPSEFELLRNFPDGSQTDLQGTLGTASAEVNTSSTPEPASIVLLASGLAGLGSFRNLRRKKK